MKDLSAFEIVIGCIGFENALKLIEQHGGLIFYIPKRPARDLSIMLEIEKELKAGYSEMQIQKNIIAKFEISNKVANKFIKECVKK